MELKSKLEKLERRYLETKESLEQSMKLTNDLNAQLLKYEGAIRLLRELTDEKTKTNTKIRNGKDDAKNS